MKLFAVPVVLCVLAACSGPPPAIRRTGVLPPGGTIIVRNTQGDVDAYAPARNDPPDRYTIDAFAASARDASVVTRPLLVTVSATRPGVRLQVRAPRGTGLDIFTHDGDVYVQDFDGIANARTDRGDIKMLIPQYGNAYAQTGNVSVIFGADSWPGTLHFGAANGNVEVYVNEHAKARVRMHTDDGTVFSDFNLTGTSSGTSETIDAPINGGGPRSIDVEVKRGSIRVMQLKPQV